MKIHFKSEKNKIILFSSVINITYLLFFLLIAFNPNGGWGNIELFIYSIYAFPILVLFFSFKLNGLKNKIVLNYLSFIIYGFLIIQELNLLSFNPVRLVGLFLLLLAPFILSLLGNIIHKRSQDIKHKHNFKK